MPNKKLRLGIIGANVGYGWTPRAHAPAIAELTDIDLVAVCTAHEAVSYTHLTLPTILLV